MDILSVNLDKEFIVKKTLWGSVIANSTGLLCESLFNSQTIPWKDIKNINYVRMVGRGVGFIEYIRVVYSSEKSGENFNKRPISRYKEISLKKLKYCSIVNKVDSRNQLQS